MHIDIKSKNVETIRNTFDHIKERFGDKPASRYQEATFDLQPTANFHYRPTWQPQFELYDVRRTAVVMEDWYKLTDPRQFYYASYVMNRARLQESADQNFTLIEKRGLLDLMPDTVKQKILNYVLPLRHYSWGGNMNNTQICAMGYGTAITAPAMFHAADHLGIAQYITRIGLLIGENEVEILDQSKKDWVEKQQWQGLRKAVEDSFVLEDWFELFVVQNFVMDGLIHPLFFNHFEAQINKEGGTAESMMTGFMADWYKETTRWVDAQLKVAASESEQNNKLITGWINKWLSVLEDALLPLATGALDDGDAIMAEIKSALVKRAEKINIKL
ncbi:MAG: aromatic/alkene monooxygenase hydroxylase subunit beta [Gammaproteobacteria bacterium]